MVHVAETTGANFSLYGVQRVALEVGQSGIGVRWLLVYVSVAVVVGGGQADQMVVEVVDFARNLYRTRAALAAAARTAQTSGVAELRVGVQRVEGVLVVSEVSYLRAKFHFIQRHKQKNLLSINLKTKLVVA